MREGERKVSSERKHGDENKMENMKKSKLVEKQMSEIRQLTRETEQESIKLTYREKGEYGICLEASGSQAGDKFFSLSAALG